MSYTPATGGFPTYFLTMLLDDERREAFRNALKPFLMEVCQRFRVGADAAHPCRLIDFGCGTGLLTQLCFDVAKELRLHIYVWLVDVNSDLLDLAGEVLTRSGFHSFSCIRGTLDRTKRTRAGATEVGADADFVTTPWPANTVLAHGLVSEILGTTAHSEGIHVYLPKALEFVMADEDGRKWAIPEKTSEYVAIYANPFFTHPHLKHIFTRIIQSDVFVATNDLCGSPVTDASFLADQPPRFRALIDVNRYGKHETDDDTVRQPLTQTVTPTDMVVLEWKAVLYSSGDTSVTLTNALSKIDDDAFCLPNPSKMNAWGFLVAFPSSSMELHTNRQPKTRTWKPGDRLGLLMNSAKRKRAFSVVDRV